MKLVLFASEAPHNDRAALCDPRWNCRVHFVWNTGKDSHQHSRLWRWGAQVGFIQFRHIPARAHVKVIRQKDHTATQRGSSSTESSHHILYCIIYNINIIIIRLIINYYIKYRLQIHDDTCQIWTWN